MAQFLNAIVDRQGITRNSAKNRIKALMARKPTLRMVLELRFLVPLSVFLTNYYLIS